MKNLLKDILPEGLGDIMKKFEEDVQSLLDSTSDMAELTASMMERAVNAFTECDVDEVTSIIADFDKVDRYDRNIEESAIRVLSLYQPTASDMRSCATVLKSITYLERIAKYSRNIAVATEYLADKPSYPVLDCISPMGDVAVRMTRLVVKGLCNKSIEGFDKICEMDDYLDKGLRSGLKEIIDFITVNPKSADVCTYYISVLKYIERVGDHACKIAEKVTYMVTGKHTVIE